MGNYSLPAVNQRVDIWFDGYDQYYGGRVDAVSAPHRFHVILDDKSQWDIDVRKNVYRLSSDLPDDPGSDGGGPGDTDGENAAEADNADKTDPPEEEPVQPDGPDNAAAAAPVHPAADVDAAAPNPSPFPNDDDMEPPVARPSPDKPASVDRDPTVAKSLDVSPLRFREAKAAPSARATRRSAALAAALAADAAAEADGEKSAATTSPVASGSDADKGGPRTRSRESPRQLAVRGAQQKRRMSGRALRKNAGNSQPRGTPSADTSATPERPRRASSVQQKRVKQRAADADAPVARADGASPARVTRASSAQPSQSTDGVARRRGRPPANGVQSASDAGRKRGSNELGSAASGAAAKRRRRSDDDNEGDADNEAETRGATSAARVTRSATAAEREPASAKDEGEKISTKTLTAIAVEAALETAKSVLKPVNDRLNKLLKELEVVTKELVASKRARDADAARPKATAASAPTPSTAVLSAAALENFEVDVSEIVGGGEARIKAYANLSQHEFDGLHRVIQQQGNALKELDRLVYAARAFGEKAKTKPKGGKPAAAGADPKSGGPAATAEAGATGNGVDAGATKQS